MRKNISKNREKAGQRLALASAQAHHAREAGRPCACVCVCVCVGRSGLEEMVIGWGLDRGWHSGGGCRDGESWFSLV
jgi:hypothetical protein